MDDLGTLLQDRGQTEMAEIAIYEALELRLLGTAHAKNEDWRQLFLARSHRHVGHLEYSRHNYEKATDACEDAVLVLEKLTIAFPHRAPYQIDLGASYTNLAVALRCREQFNDAMLNHHKAIAIQEKLVANDPTFQPLANDFALSVYQTGRTFYVSGQPADAIPHFQRALELDPQLARAANMLAWTWLMAPDPMISNPGLALPIARRAVDLAPQAGDHWNTLGVAHYRIGDDDEAVVALTRSIDLRGGGDGLDWFFLAMAHARRGEDNLAKDWYERAQTWCRTQAPLSDELQRTQAEAVRAIEELVH
jgi:eukaryotic-like serine/threonine-protein kinase